MNRFYKLAVVAAVGTLGLTACGGTTTGGSSANTSGSASGTACPTGKLVGGGSTAQALAINTLTSAYAAKCAGAQIQYSATGSGAGVKNFYNAQYDWAGSDSPLSTTPNADKVIEVDKAKARCGNNQAWDLPMVLVCSSAPKYSR